jgi:hypothetical protein
MVEVVAASELVEINPVFKMEALVIPMEAFKVEVLTLVRMLFGMVEVVAASEFVEINPVFKREALVIPVEAVKEDVLTLV